MLRACAARGCASASSFCAHWIFRVCVQICGSFNAPRSLVDGNICWFWFSATRRAYRAAHCTSCARFTTRQFLPPFYRSGSCTPLRDLIFLDHRPFLRALDAPHLRLSPCRLDRFTWTVPALSRFGRAGCCYQRALNGSARFRLRLRAAFCASYAASGLRSRYYIASCASAPVRRVFCCCAASGSAAFISRGLRRAGCLTRVRISGHARTAAGPRRSKKKKGWTIINSFGPSAHLIRIVFCDRYRAGCLRSLRSAIVLHCA